jgi:cyclopropane fatty-acyl-phospholipid synthase-like methyltransferase
MIKINVGCGPYKKFGYINIDKNEVWSPEIVLDVRQGLPYADDFVDEIMAHHFIEHLTKDEIIAFLADCYKKLKPNGVLDLVFPLGVTWDLDHKSFLGEDSLKMILDQGSEGIRDEYYFGPHISFIQVIKEKFRDKNFEMLHISMKAKK